MKLIHTFILLFVAMLTHAQQYGNEIKDATLQLSKLKTTSDATQSISSDFTLEKKVSLMANVEKSFGKFYYQRQGCKICLDYTQPKDNKIIINDSKFVLVTAGKASTMDVTRNPALSQMKNMITACMTGDFLPLGERSVTKYFDDEKLFTIVIQPSNKRVKRYMSEIVLRFDKQDNTLKSMRFAEQNGDYSEYTYTNKNINVAINANHFKP